MDEPTPPDVSAPMPQVDGFRLVREVGHGGMSTVYLAEQTALGRQVALKIMSRHALADEISRRRFENEVRTIARLEHPHIVRIYELGRTRDGVPFYSMPHLARGHLGDKNFVHDEAGAVSVATALLAALEYAHSRGVVHRDVKPENVLFDDAGRPLLADFGIALRRGSGPRVTAAGLAVGSTAYMAPEQARGEDVDGRADLYSLGVVMWEMLAGRLPYEADDALSMALMHAQNPIPRLPAHLRHWQRFMYRALAKNADQRFQKVAEMREAMLAVRPPRWLPAWERARSIASHRVVKGIAIAAVLAGVAAGAMALWPHNPGDRFYRAPHRVADPAATADPQPDPTEAMLAPLPGASLEVAIANARAQIARNALTTPEGENALMFVTSAWRDSPTDPRVLELVDEFTDAMRARLVASVKAGDDARARDLFARNDEFMHVTARPDMRSQVALRTDTAAAVRARFDDALKRSDRKRAQQALALAHDLRVPAVEVQKWSHDAERLDASGASLAATADAGGARGSVSSRPVSRAEFERFANATHRTPSLCRERASLFRVLAPRTWKSPGFAQGPSDPVVCVSLQDAEAYAMWLGSQSGHSYRLPTSSESGRVSPDTGARALSLWLRDCGSNCLQRVVTAGSWRGRKAPEPLQAARGYDDVGFRLVRDR